MILICDVVGLNDTQLHHITDTLQNYEVLTLQLPSNAIDVYEKLAHCSLCIERCLLNNDTFVANTKFTSILILFDNYINDIGSLHLHVHNMRTDELIFPSRTPTYKSGWLAGHPLAVIKLLSSILDLKRFEWPANVALGWGNPFKTINPNYTNDITHWANRIQLKVGALE